MSNKHRTAFPVNHYTGLTIREYFAALAFQAIVQSGRTTDKRFMAKEAVELADNLISELDKE